jgi:hypothetical protein
LSATIGIGMYLASANEGFVDTEEALALELNDGAVLHIAQCGLSNGEGHLAAVRIDEVFDVFALRVGNRSENESDANIDTPRTNLFDLLLGNEMIELDEFKQHTVVMGSARHPVHLHPQTVRETRRSAA